MVLVHAATQKHHFHVQLPKSTTVLGVPQLPSVVLLLFLMCSLDHDVSAFRGKWWRPQEVSLDSPSEKKWLILKLFHLLQLIFSSAGNSTRPRPKQEGKYVENLLDFVKASFASPGHDVGILTRGHQWECQFCHVDSPVSCPVLGPQKRIILPLQSS